jgi:hypothetical protein
MIYLIHGQNIVDSRRFLIKFKQSYQNIELINGKNSGTIDIKNSIERLSHHLFAKKTAVLIEFFNGDWSIFSKKVPDSVDLILWSDEKVKTGRFKAKEYLFDRARRTNAFKLADAILFKNEREAQILSSELLNSKEPVERIIGTLNRSFYLTYCEKERLLDDKDLPTFAHDKIREQARLWNKIAIKKALLALLRLDLDMKEGLKVGLAFPAFVSRVVSL